MADPANLREFLSEEQQRTVEQAIGVLEQFRNSAASQATPHVAQQSSNM